MLWNTGQVVIDRRTRKRLTCMLRRFGSAASIEGEAQDRIFQFNFATQRWQSFPFSFRLNHQQPLGKSVTSNGCSIAFNS